MGRAWERIRAQREADLKERLETWIGTVDLTAFSDRQAFQRFCGENAAEVAEKEGFSRIKWRIIADEISGPIGRGFYTR